VLKASTKDRDEPQLTPQTNIAGRPVTACFLCLCARLCLSVPFGWIDSIMRQI